MKLYRISQELNNDYDTYSDAVVAAEDESSARNIHPRNETDWKDADEYPKYSYATWVSRELVKVEYLGEAKEGTVSGVICSSFHAG
jgi:hypothetical protein